MNQAIRLVLQTRAFKAFLEALPRGRVRAGGLTHAAASLVAAALALGTRREVLLVAAHIDLAEELYENVRLFVPGAALLEPSDRATSFEATPAVEAASSRVRLLRRYLPDAERPRVVVTCAAALTQGVPSARDLAAGTLQVETGSRLEMTSLARWLVEHDFTREYEAGRPWEFALRGGIADVFCPGEGAPVRIEFFGDEVVSIRSVDPATLLGAEQLDSVRLVAPASSSSRHDSSPFTRLLAPDAVVLVQEPGDVQQAAERHAAGLSSVDTVAWEDIWKSFEEFTLVESTEFEFADEDSISFESRAFSIAAREMDGILEEFADFARRMRRTLVFTLNDAEKSRLEDLFRETIADSGRKRLFSAVVGRFNRSFYFAESRLAFIAHQDIFHRYRTRRDLRLSAPSRPIAAIAELVPGDYLVHIDHGIARYEGTKIIKKDSVQREYLVLEFAGGTRLLVPVSHINLVSKYLGASDRPPTLSRIGSKVWKVRKARIARAVRELAAELMRLQALRASKPGNAYRFDPHYQDRFEAEFIYEETDDQLRALAEIKRDMGSARPMDRLLCGDVGFGKTELAVRAAFAVATSGRQVAVLVPTTILAEQHYRTFTERMMDYPILIEVLSRLRSKRLQRETLERLRRKQADIVIGTHRLIQKDVLFADLGLVIIDEEQRFGVEAKERLKRLRETVDVLTLTATPIPRTLHMALVGLRDICVLETPPQGRRSISTFVGTLSPGRLREIILRELDREGQVFFVHNRVHSIEKAAARVRQIVPEARVAVAHGQMGEDLLASRMLDFVAGKYDVLVATTIIESGLDIPNANTIIVDEADIFGLADLHQLRGRVGRYKRHAYAYFLLPEARPVSPEARKRLQAIEHFSELGAGFQIALRDMEIRGVGNVLGREQSGHIAAVGYELYCQLLAEAVDDLKGRPAKRIPQAYLELGTGCHIPASYVESPSHRLDLYRRISTAVSIDDMAAIEAEMADRFGPLPNEASEFIDLAKLRILAFAAGIEMIMRRKDHLVVQAGDIEAVAGVFAGPGRTVRVIDERTAYVFFSEGLDGTARLPALVINILQGGRGGI